MAVPVRTATSAPAALDDSGSFIQRHVGPTPHEVRSMLDTLGYPTLDALIDATIPESIRFRRLLDLPPAESEHEALLRLKGIASQNKVFKSYLGQGYYGTIVPAVIQRTVLENPGWYTAYTPYQAEIAQGPLDEVDARLRHGLHDLPHHRVVRGSDELRPNGLRLGRRLQEQLRDPFTWVGKSFHLCEQLTSVDPVPRLQRRPQQVIPTAEVVVGAALRDAEMSRHLLHPHRARTVLLQDDERCFDPVSARQRCHRAHTIRQRMIIR